MTDVQVVDDDFRVPEINAAYVAEVPGFRVVSHAHTAAQALSFLERDHVGLVLLDHHLPGETGPTLVRQLRHVLSAAERPLSAHEVAARAGIGDCTAQRYLKCPEDAGRIGLSLKYGGTGRPEHRHAWAGLRPEPLR
ncbi:response regulator [Streptomyces sp. NPDC001880]